MRRTARGRETGNVQDRVKEGRQEEFGTERGYSGTE